METKRSSFTGKIGFVLAAAGSAVGLGNIWRFPYLAAKYGGGIFLLVYLILAVTFGFTLMITEIAIGRKTGQSPIGAFGKLHKKAGFIGIIASVIPALILPYYSVIGGWVMKWMFGFMTGGMEEMATDTFFGSYTAEVWQPLLWFALFIGITAVIVLFGVEKGVEKVSKVMMPVLIVLILSVAIYSIVAIPGAWEGVLYYITPDFSKFSAMTVVAAMGQLFYSMSLAMGIMITFGSYMKKEISIEKSVGQIEIFDTGVAFLAGLLIVPAVYAFSGGNEAALGQGPGLMFVTLPKVFESIPGGAFVGFAFFLMVFFAALTSSISLMETVVSTVMDKFRIGRKTCCFIVLGISLLLGIPSSLGFSAWSSFTILGMDILSFFDFFTNSILMPVVALATTILVAYILKPKTVSDEVELSGKFSRKKLYEIMIKYVAAVCIVAILVFSMLDVFGILKI